MSGPEFSRVSSRESYAQATKHSAVASARFHAIAIVYSYKVEMKAKRNMQTVLGAGGPIGQELAKILPEYTGRVRLVSRHPQKVLPSNELCPADLTNRAEVARVVGGSDVVYLVAGLPYRTRIWQEQWPLIMNNVIEACRDFDSKLVFFDNIYMYDRDRLSPMDENTPVRPASRKGKVRAEIAETLMSSVRRGDVDALIARCADYYGPGKPKNSVLTLTVFDRLASGKSAQWLLSTGHAHSFTYTTDAARGTAILGNSDDAFGEVWHLPTATHPPTGRGWIESIAEALGVEPKTQVASNGLLTLLGLFNADLRELKEMAYQYDREYEFVSEKFTSRFGFEPTAYETGIKTIVENDYR